MSRVRTLWGGMFALLMVIGLVAPAFAQDTAANNAAAADQVKDQDNLLVPAVPAPSPTMALADDEGTKKEWYEKLWVKGSFRFRNQYNYTEGRSGTYGNGNGFLASAETKDYRMRYRLLIDIGGTFDDFSFGAELGSSGSAVSANETYTGDFAPGALFIRRAWVSFGIADDMLGVTFGRFDVPDTMYRSILTWDSDLGMTGIHLVFRAMEEKDEKDKVTQALYINALMLMATDDGSLGATDTMIFAGTVDFRMDLSDTMGIQAGAGIWTASNPQGNGNWQFASEPVSGEEIDFAALEVYAKFTMDLLSVYAHILYNMGGSRGFGGLGGVSFWTAKKGTEGALGLDLIYYYQQTGAWPSNLSDADSGVFGSMSGSAGIEFNVMFYITSNVALGLETNFYIVNEDTSVGIDDHDKACTLIFDAYFWF